MSKGNSVCVKTYLKPELFAEMIEYAEKTGNRRKGLLLYTQKPHGFAGEKLANTDGLAKYFKFLHAYYKNTEAERLERAARISRQEEEIRKEKEKMGLI